MSEQEERLEDGEQDEPPEDEDGAPGERASRPRAEGEHLALRALTPEEKRLVVAIARRAWRRWSGALPGCSQEDLEIEGALVVTEQRPAAARPVGERMPFLAVCIHRRFQKFVAREFHDRGKLPGLREVVISEERARELADESAADWEALVGDSLVEKIGDERLGTALRSLSPLDRRILDLRYIDRLTDERIAARLNDAMRSVEGWQKLTGEAVRNRRRRALSALRTAPRAEGEE